jgi:hypothetical protein
MNCIDQFGMETVDAVLQLAKVNHWLQGLVVLYSAIDTFAWASRNSGDVTRLDVCGWVSAYMNPTVELDCTPEDLYAARCSLLHSSTTESKMSRKGQARELWYVTSPYSAATMQSHVRQGGATAKVLNMTALIDAFSRGVMKFSDDLSSDEARFRAASDRIRRWLRFVPSEALR